MRVDIEGSRWEVGTMRVASLVPVIVAALRAAQAAGAIAMPAR
jgi:hypothetical protein